MDTCVNGHERISANMRYITNQTTGKVTRRCKLCDDLAKLRYEENRKARRGKCSVDECSNVEEYRGLCTSHRKLDLKGIELTKLQKHETVLERISSRVNIDSNGCWIWKGPDGYANFTFAGKKKLAHRAAFEAHHDVVLTRTDVLDHLCMIKACVNPAHVDRVTQRENSKRSQAFYSMQEKYENLARHLRMLGYSDAEIERIANGQELTSQMALSGLRN